MGQHATELDLLSPSPISPLETPQQGEDSPAPELTPSSTLHPSGEVSFWSLLPSYFKESAPMSLNRITAGNAEMALSEENLITH